MNLSLDVIFNSVGPTMFVLFVQGVKVKVYFTHDIYDNHPLEHVSQVYAFILKNFVHVYVHKHKRRFQKRLFYPNRMKI